MQIQQTASTKGCEAKPQPRNKQLFHVWWRDAVSMHPFRRNREEVPVTKDTPWSVSILEAFFVEQTFTFRLSNLKKSEFTEK